MLDSANSRSISTTQLAQLYNMDSKKDYNYEYMLASFMGCGILVKDNSFNTLL
jgi:hypothetical protein